MRIILLFIFLFFTSIYFCSKVGSTQEFEQYPPGSYSYQSHDSIGTLIARGWLEIEFVDSLVIGSWNIQNLSGRDNIGPQQGKGELQGEITESTIIIDLNPQFRDNNLILKGKILNNEYHGTWQWVSFVGVSNWGTFVATQKNHN